MTEGECQALRTYRYGWAKLEFHMFDPVPCPVCGKECGGKSIIPGQRGRTEGVIAHLRFKHMMTKKEAQCLLEATP